MSDRLVSPARRRLAADDGFTLIEMAIVVALLGVVLAALTQLFVSASHSQLDITNRFSAQQNARLALDSLRREIHCAGGVTGTYPGSTITITLGASCPTNPTPGTIASVVWCTQKIDPSGNPSTTTTNVRYALFRYTTAPATCGTVATTRVKKADYLTTGNVFTAYNYPGANNGVRATLSIDLPVDLTPATAVGRYELTDDIVLRNSAR